MSGNNVYTFAPSEIPTSVKLNAALANAASSGLTAPFAATGGVALRTAATRAADVFRLVDFSATTDPDDTLALMRMYACWAANPRGGVMLFPTRRETMLGVGANITMVVGAGQSLVLGADGGREARIRFASGFSGTFLTINGANSTSRPEGPTVRLEGLEGITTSTGTAGQFFAITGAPNGNAAPSPGLVIEDIRLMNDEGGCWQQGGSIFAMNVTRLKRMHCFGWTDPASVGLSYDTDTRISVEHDIDDFYMNGGGTALKLGNNTISALNLQGFTVRRPSFTGCVNGIVATCVSGLDQILIDGGQINCSGIGISATNVSTLNSKGCYFLNNGTGISVNGGTRAMLVANEFDLGAPTATPGNGTNNLAVILNNCNGSTDSGSLVVGNLFTNNYGATPCVQLTGYTNYATVVINHALQGTCCVDTTGNPSNTIEPNYEGGSVSTINLGPLASRAIIKEIAGNLQLTPPTSGNVAVNGPLLLQSPNGTTAGFETVANTGILTLSSAGLVLAPRVGNATDAPALAFSYGGYNYTVGVNPTLNKLVFYNTSNTAIMSVDANGNAIFRGTVTQSGTP